MEVKEKNDSLSTGKWLQTQVAQVGASKRKVVVSSLVLGLIALSAFFFLPKKVEEKKSVGSEKAVLTVSLVPAKRLQISRKLLVNGTVWSWDPISIGSEVGGLKVDSIKVDEGDTVHAGQVMATLSSSILKAQLDREEARLLGAKASLSKSIQPNRPEDLTSLKAAYAQSLSAVASEEANLARARANHREAAENAKRYGWLVSQGAVSAQEADNRRTLSDVAMAEVNNCLEKVNAAKFSAQQAHERLSMGIGGGRREDIDLSRSQLLETEANIKQLKSQLEQTIIKAPCTGLVSKRYVHLGDIATAGKTMFDVVRDGRLELRAQVPEQDLSRVKEGQAVEMQALDGKPLKGVVREISPLVDESSRLGMVRIDIDSDAGKGSNNLQSGNLQSGNLHSGNLHPGNFLRGEILLGSTASLVVPTSALVFKDNHSMVYQVESNKVQMRFVKTGERDGQRVEILEGLKDGDNVVEKGAGFLKDGDLVRVLK